jgi:hypothetical protein
MIHWATFLKSEKPYLKLQEKLFTYTAMLTNTTKLITHHKTLKNITSDLQGDISWLAVEEPYNKLIVKINTFKELATKENNLQKLWDTLAPLETGLLEGKLGIDILVVKYSHILEESGTCPTCMSKIDSKMVSKIQTKLLEV